MPSRQMTLTFAAILVALAPIAGAQQPEGPTTVVALLATHDRSLLDSLKSYINENPDAEDLEQAYLILFEKAIENDWYLENEAVARNYLDDRLDGAVAPLARIVATMARAADGQFAEAFADYQILMAGLGEPEQEEFASNFADSLARKAIAAGNVGVARQVYETLRQRFRSSPTLRQRVDDELARLDRIGKPAPEITVRDVQGKVFQLNDLRGKVVLVDFWATWCGPWVADLPTLKATYDRYHDRGFEIVGISLDESTRPIIEFVEARGIPWRQIHNTTSGADLVSAFGITSIPASFLVGPDGTIERLDPQASSLDATLQELLK